MLALASGRTSAAIRCRELSARPPVPTVRQLSPRGALKREQKGTIRSVPAVVRRLEEGPLGHSIVVRTYYLSIRTLPDSGTDCALRTRTDGIDRGQSRGRHRRSSATAEAPPARPGLWQFVLLSTESTRATSLDRAHNRARDKRLRVSVARRDLCAGRTGRAKDCPERGARRHHTRPVTASAASTLRPPVPLPPITHHERHRDDRRADSVK